MTLLLDRPRRRREMHVYFWSFASFRGRTDYPYQSVPASITTWPTALPETNYDLPIAVRRFLLPRSQYLAVGEPAGRIR
jgi:hypothetical protein